MGSKMSGAKSLVAPYCVSDLSLQETYLFALPKASKYPRASNHYNQNVITPWKHTIWHSYEQSEPENIFSGRHIQ